MTVDKILSNKGAFPEPNGTGGTTGNSPGDFFETSVASKRGVKFKSQCFQNQGDSKVPVAWSKNYLRGKAKGK